MPNILHINRLHEAAKTLDAIRAQLDQLLADAPCGCGECLLCHGLAMLATDADALAASHRADVQAYDNRFEYDPAA